LRRLGEWISWRFLEKYYLGTRWCDFRVSFWTFVFTSGKMTVHLYLGTVWEYLILQGKKREMEKLPAHIGGRNDTQMS
jgi:hypothetical protein